jgi:hypothetical protein
MINIETNYYNNLLIINDLINNLEISIIYNRYTYIEKKFYIERLKIINNLINLIKIKENKNKFIKIKIKIFLRRIYVMNEFLKNLIIYI